MNESESLRLIHSILLLTLISSALLFHFRNRLGKALKYAGIWFVIIMFTVLLHSYLGDFAGIKDRLISSLSPSTAITNNDGSISVRASINGHFYINTKVNGKNIKFMVDTGATDVVIDRNIAKKIGIDITELDFIKTYHTANGKVLGAPIRIETIEFGNFIIKDVRASVNDADINKPLLGMSFLNQLDGYEVKNDVLTLWP